MRLLLLAAAAISAVLALVLNAWVLIMLTLALVVLYVLVGEAQRGVGLDDD